MGSLARSFLRSMAVDHALRMRIESTHHVQQREGDERECAAASIEQLLNSKYAVQAEINRVSRWARGSNGEDRLRRRLRAIEAELASR